MTSRKRSLFQRLLWGFNLLFGLALLLAYCAPYVAPKTSPFLSVFNLITPLLLLVNTGFFIFWLLGLKRELFFSLIILALGFNRILSLYKFTPGKNIQKEGDVTLMSYNVLQFNRFHNLDKRNVPTKMHTFIDSLAPDILCFQEYVYTSVYLTKYPYKDTYLKRGKSSMAIFSKYRIENRGAIEFPHSANGAMYADILIHHQKIRLFNVHLQSLEIHPNLTSIDTEKDKRKLKRMKKAFKKQQKQVKRLRKAMENSPYPVILCGDFNNTASSYVYHQLAKGMQDAFLVAGHGLGRTFLYDFVPLRIDFILMDPHFTIHHFENYKVKLSDHYPISARFQMK